MTGGRELVGPPPGRRGGARAGGGAGRGAGLREALRAARRGWPSARRSIRSALPAPADYGEALLELLGSPTIASKEWAFRQYDQQVGINTLVLPGSDAGVLRVKGTRRALAVATDGNGRQVFLDPRRGAAMAVCEAARNVSCAGGRPLGVTDCLNFGSPERPEILWQFAEAIEGIAEACRALELPVVGGNVSFYNETDEFSARPILPTPIIGVVGRPGRRDAARHAVVQGRGPSRRAAGTGRGEPRAASEYLWTRHGQLGGRLAPLDLELERRVQAAVRAAVGRRAGHGRARLRGGRRGRGAGRGVRHRAGRRSGARPRWPAGAPARPRAVRRGPVAGRRERGAGAGAGVRGADGGVGDPVALDRDDGRRPAAPAGGRETVVDVGLDQIEHAWRNGFERHMA